MNEGKDLRVALLLDFYSPLLTEKQRDVIDLYYNEDLSLAEIAEQKNVSRQGIRDSIKRGEQTLTELEAALGLAGKAAALRSIADELSRCADKMSPEEIRAAAQKLRGII